MTLIVPRGDRWSDEYLWRVPYTMIDAGGVDCGFSRWCRTNFVHDWRFENLGDGRWNLRMTSPDDYALLILLHNESPVPEADPPSMTPDPIEAIYRENLTKMLGRQARGG